VADHIELFEPGDLVLIGSNVPHYWHQRGKARGLALQWDFPLDHGIWMFVEAGPLRTLEESARRGLHIRGATALGVQKRMEQLAGTTCLARLGIFLEMLAEIIMAPAGDIRPLAPRPFSLTGTAEQQEAMRRAVSYILAHYREPLQLQDLLDLVAMSRATFIRQFRRHAGKSFSEFVKQVRLQAVCRAMRDTTDSIGSVALSQGFNNLSFFNRLFRQEFGVTPSDYRTGSWSRRIA
jgi:AraC-like DNA-binding protein